ncbi:MAG: mechanosensitive ion channel [Muribaculaceae bacterium]|nr:mechanosensitive ion channel [Muribaculaceae bacterium]
MEIILVKLNELLTEMGVAPDHLFLVSRLVIISLIILLVIASYHFCHKILAKVVRRLTSRTAATWDDILFNDHVLYGVCHLLPPIILYIFLPLVFEGNSLMLTIISKSCFIYIVLAALRLITSFISALYLVSCEKQQTTSHPLKGVYQMLKLIFICVAVIIIISILVDKNPVVILTGLGAAAAVLTLVFKDTILGLVAGVQLSANDMLRPGDWIEAPKYGANGTVKEVTLTTVKVQNWDMTITTIPPYVLISDSFQNWRGMFNSGGRRVKRSIEIDVNTVRFSTEAELADFEQRGWLKGIDHETEDLVNMRVFRNYMEQYISTHPLVNHDMLMLVRQLQPSAHGIPIEFYFFTAKQDWITYERIQAAILEHAYAMLPAFGLRAFQSPAGTDIQSIANSSQS